MTALRRLAASRLRKLAQVIDIQPAAAKTSYGIEVRNTGGRYTLDDFFALVHQQWESRI